MGRAGLPVDLPVALALVLTATLGLLRGLLVGFALTVPDGGGGDGAGAWDFLRAFMAVSRSLVGSVDMGNPLKHLCGYQLF